MDARGARAAHRGPGAVDVAGGGAGEAGDGGAFALPRDLADRGEVAVGGDGEARLDDVDAERLELGGDAQLLLEVHRAARRLLAVAQGRVENPDLVGHCRVACVRWNDAGGALVPAAAPAERRVPRGG